MRVVRSGRPGKEERQEQIHNPFLWKPADYICTQLSTGPPPAAAAQGELVAACQARSGCQGGLRWASKFVGCIVLPSSPIRVDPHQANNGRELPGSLPRSWP